MTKVRITKTFKYDKVLEADSLGRYQVQDVGSVTGSLVTLRPHTRSELTDLGFMVTDVVEEFRYFQYGQITYRLPKGTQNSSAQLETYDPARNKWVKSFYMMAADIFKMTEIPEPVAATEPAPEKAWVYYKDGHSGMYYRRPYGSTEGSRGDWTTVDGFWEVKFSSLTNDAWHPSGGAPKNDFLWLGYHDPTTN